MLGVLHQYFSCIYHLWALPVTPLAHCLLAQLTTLYQELLNPRHDHECAPFLRNTVVRELLRRMAQDLEKDRRRPPSIVDKTSVRSLQREDP